MRAPLGRIYLLTADHCFTDKTAISDFEFWLLIFNYETGCGSDDAPPFEYIVQARGAVALAAPLSSPVLTKAVLYDSTSIMHSL